MICTVGGNTDICIIIKNNWIRLLFWLIGLCGSDARPTGYQEVADSTPAGSTTFFHGDLIMKYFLWSVILSLPLIQEGQLSVSGERMRTFLVNHLED